MNSTLWLITTIVAVAGALGMGLVLRNLHRRLTDALGGFQAWQLRFKYTADDVKADWAKLGSAQPVMKRFCLLFVPMLFFAALCMAVVAHNAAEIRWMRHIMYGLTALACAFGLTETLLLPQKGKAASVCSLAKWACFAVWTVGMFAGLFIRSAAL